MTEDEGWDALMVAIRVIREDGADPAIALPSYETAGAAGADVRANLPNRGSITLQPGERALVPTGT